MEKYIKIDEKDSKHINYFRQISECSDLNLFLSPFGGVVLKGCDDNGDILEFANIPEYERFMTSQNVKLWLYLRLKVFRYENNGLETFGVYICPSCEEMTGIQELSDCQDPFNLFPQLCIHSRVASMIVGNWREHWNISMSLSFDCIHVISNEEVNYVKFISESSSFPFLAAVLEKKVVSLLYCATRKQESPFCTTCVRRKCHHFSKLKDYFSNLPQEEEDINSEEEAYEPSAETEEDDMDFKEHYLTTPPNHIRGLLYGYNFKPIPYPFCDSPQLGHLWLERMSGQVNIPDRLVPVFDINSKCKHEAGYMSGEDGLVRESENLVLYNELGERIFETEIFSRPTEGSCKCLQRFDGSDLLIWHLGRGRCVDFTLLVSYLHKWRGTGMSIYGLYRSLIDAAESCGITSSLKYADLHKSVCGFFCNLQFDTAVAFSCPCHGTSPHWVVADGKALGPLKRRVEHLSEFDVRDGDSVVLEQSTNYKDRIFMNIKKGKLSNRKSNETWELVQSGDDPPLIGMEWNFFELGTLLKWVDPPPKINLELF